MQTVKTLLITLRNCQGVHCFWDTCVKKDAIELLENALEENEGKDIKYQTLDELENLLLNGASDWKQYSYGGCHYIYTTDIVERYGTFTQYDAYMHGDSTLNDGDYWLSLQAKCLADAMELIRRASRYRYYAVLNSYLFYPTSTHTIGL